MEFLIVAAAVLAQKIDFFLLAPVVGMAYLVWFRAGDEKLLLPVLGLHLYYCWEFPANCGIGYVLFIQGVLLSSSLFHYWQQPA